MPGNASRINGQKGGRPKGSENFDTKQRREMRNRWFQYVHAKADEIFESHLALAIGIYTEKETSDGVQRVYKRPPDARALHWIMEQAWGKALDTTPLEEADKNEGYTISEEDKRSIARAIRFALPENRRIESS